MNRINNCEPTISIMFNLPIDTYVLEILCDNWKRYVYCVHKVRIDILCRTKRMAGFVELCILVVLFCNVQTTRRESRTQNILQSSAVTYIHDLGGLYASAFYMLFPDAFIDADLIP